jgi:hypothetical protein
MTAFYRILFRRRCITQERKIIGTIYTHRVMEGLHRSDALVDISFPCNTRIGVDETGACKIYTRPMGLFSDGRGLRPGGIGHNSSVLNESIEVLCKRAMSPSLD